MSPRIRSRFEASLGNFSSFGSYLNSYHRAFKILIKHVEDSASHVDEVAYPLLFIARHCLELGFKANIRHFQKYSGRTDHTKSGSHSLKDLFHAFKLHIDSTITNLKDTHGIEVEPTEIAEFKTFCEKVGKLTAYFDVVDKGSYSFRYPVDHDNKRNFEYTDTKNLLDIEELIDESMILLNHTADVFGKYTHYHDEIEKIYQQQMMESFGPW